MCKNIIGIFMFYKFTFCPIHFSKYLQFVLITLNTIKILLNDILFWTIMRVNRRKYIYYQHKDTDICVDLFQKCCFMSYISQQKTLFYKKRRPGESTVVEQNPFTFIISLLTSMILCVRNLTVVKTRSKSLKTLAMENKVVK